MPGLKSCRRTKSRRPNWSAADMLNALWLGSARFDCTGERKSKCRVGMCSIFLQWVVVGGSTASFFVGSTGTVGVFRRMPGIELALRWLGSSISYTGRFPCGCGSVRQLQRSSGFVSALSRGVTWERDQCGPVSAGRRCTRGYCLPDVSPATVVSVTVNNPFSSMACCRNSWTIIPLGASP